MTTAAAERRDPSTRNWVRRRLWHVGVGWWGLLMVLSVHQAGVAVSLGVDVWITHDSVVDVLWPQAQPFIFAAAAIGAWDAHRAWSRGRAIAAHALMLGSYLSRAMVMVLGTIRGGSWSTSVVVAVVTWLVLAAVAHLAWSKVRRAAACSGS